MAWREVRFCSVLVKLFTRSRSAGCEMALSSCGAFFFTLGAVLLYQVFMVSNIPDSCKESSPILNTGARAASPSMARSVIPSKVAESIEKLPWLDMDLATLSIISPLILPPAKIARCAMAPIETPAGPEVKGVPTWKGLLGNGATILCTAVRVSINLVELNESGTVVDSLMYSAPVTFPPPWDIFDPFPSDTSM